MLSIDYQALDDLKLLKAFVTFLKDPSVAAKAVADLSDTLDRMDSVVSDYRATLKAQDVMATAEQTLEKAKVDSEQLVDKASKEAASISAEAKAKADEADKRMRAVSDKAVEVRSREDAVKQKELELATVQIELDAKHKEADELQTQLANAQALLNDKLSKLRQLAV